MNQERPAPDITGRKEIETFVNAFYDRVRADPRLGPVFDEVAGVDWDEHLPKLYAFWETVLFRTGGYKGNPLAAHQRLMPRVAMEWSLFERWLELFHLTIDENFSGENAGHLKRVADDMARVIHSRIHALPQIPQGMRRPASEPVE